MKTKLLLATFAVSAIATSAAAQEGRGDYVQFNIGSGVVGNLDLKAIDGDNNAVGTGDVDLDAGLFVSVAAGTNAGSYPIRIEGELVFTENDIDISELAGLVDSGTISSQSAFINAIYDFKVDRFTPYLGGGIGYGRVGYEFDGDEQNDRGVVYQIKAGVNFPVSDVVTVDIGYRYLNMAEFERSDSDISLEAESNAHIVSIGARYGF